jgi:FkbM family methyltransferase
VFKAIPYPHFLYHSAIDHANTLSEDVHFCNQARDRGFTLWADTNVICDHIGSYTFRVNAAPVTNPIAVKPQHTLKDYLRNLRKQILFPVEHIQYLESIKNINPKIIYDIGSGVLHWTDSAKTVWPNARYFVFDAMEDCESLYQEAEIDYNIGVLSDRDNRQVDFYENKEHFAGNSYYRENPKFSPAAAHLFDDAHCVKKTTITLDTVIKNRGFPLPDLIKMDIQGAELDVLKGAHEALKNCQDLILEISHVEYNKGAPKKEEIISYVEKLGFKLIKSCFATASGSMDGDYHFSRKVLGI